MKKIIFIACFMCTLILSAQQQKINYKETPLAAVVQDLEKRFNVKFSFNSALLADKNFTYKGKTDLEDVLTEISMAHNIQVEFLDSSNIIIKKFEEIDDDTLEQLNFLDEVLVTAEYLTSGFDKNKKDGTLTLQPGKLGVLPGLVEPDVMQSLQMLPGISSPSESASNLHIRGGTPDQNLILFDGIKMYHQGHLFGMISPYNPYITENVSIYRSGTSAKYGDRIAGVIDMQTTNKVPEKLEAGVGANFLNADAFIKAPIAKEKVGIVLSARKSLTDYYESPTFTSYGNKVFQNTKISKAKNTPTEEQEEEEAVLNNKFMFTDVNAKLIVQLNKNHTVSVSGLLVDNSLDFLTGEAPVDGDKFSDRLNLKNQGVNFNWQGKLTEKFFVGANAYYSHFNADYNFKETEEAVVDNSFTKFNDIIDLGAQLQVGYNLNTKNTLTLGYDWTNLDVNYKLQQVGGDNPFLTEKSTQLNPQSVFLEHEYRNEKLYFRAGIRGSYFSQIKDFAVEPRFYIDYKIDNHFTLKGSAEIKNQAISQLVSFEVTGLGLDNSVWTVADKKDIPILNNQQFTGGVLFSKRGWKVDVEGYYKKVTGLSSFTQGFSVANQTNTYTSGESTIYGVDFLLKKRIRKFRTWLGYSLSKNEFLFKDISKDPFPGNFDQRHVVSWSNTYKYKGFQFSLGWQFSSGNPYTKARLVTGNDTEPEEPEEPENRLKNTTANQLIIEKVNGAQLPYYHRLDASAVYDFFLDSKNTIKARLGVSVMNVYNQNNIMDKRFRRDRNSEGDIQLTEVTTNGVKLTPNIVFRVNF